MRARRYIKEMILRAMSPDGSYSRDLVESVSQELGRPISKQGIGVYLSKMHESGEVRREEEMEFGAMKRYRWFKIE